jgi:hypothetical protein
MVSVFIPPYEEKRVRNSWFNNRYDRYNCGLVVRVSGYRFRGPVFDFWRFQIF